MFRYSQFIATTSLGRCLLFPLLVLSGFAQSLTVRPSEREPSEPAVMSTPQSPNNLSGKSSKQRIRAAIDLHLRDRIRIEDATTSGMGFDVEQKIDAWERIGFLDDEIFVRNFLDRMNRIQVFGDTKKQDLEHPDCVAVGRTKRGVCCSGTLVAPRVVITAAHCNSPSQ